MSRACNVSSADSCAGRRLNERHGAGEGLVRMEAIGVNFIEVYHRKGLYKSGCVLTMVTLAVGRASR